MSIFGDHKDIDSVLISFLDIDDLRNLYRINRYYHDLIKPKLQDYITAFSNNRGDRLLKAMHTNNINVVKYFCDNYALRMNNNNYWQSIAFNMTKDISYDMLDYIESIKPFPFFDMPNNKFAAIFRDSKCLMYCMLENSCINNAINILEWGLKKLGEHNATIHYYGTLFSRACLYENLKIAKLLIEKNTGKYDMQRYFTKVCKKGLLEVAKWLLSIDNSINIRANNDIIFKSLCETGNIPMMNFLCSLVPEYNYYTTSVIKYNYVIE